MIIGLLLFFLQKLQPLEVQILKQQTLEGIPSASGIEIVNGIIYIIGDDSPYLYSLDHNLKLLEKIELYPATDFTSGRIPKSKKQDLECMTSLVIHQQHYLFIAGSGANEHRDIGYLVKLPTRFNKKHLVTAVSLRELYTLIRQNEDVVQGGGLNLEAAACTESQFFLFNRANGQAPNTALVFDLEEMIVFLHENPEYVPFPAIVKYDLPAASGKPGFSGATVYDDMLFITASIEDTPNNIEDGEVLGSYVGYIGVSQNTGSRHKNKTAIDPQISSISLLQLDGQPYAGKVESICILEKENKDHYTALAVTDNDDGASKLLMLDIRL